MGILVFVLLFSAAGYLAYHTLTTAPIPDPVPETSDFVCTETHKHFEYAMKLGEKWPVPSPYSGKNSGYPAERCYWTRDGKRKSEPTYIILNQNLGKPGDTICPDCGRLVVGHNPPPPEAVPLVDAPPVTATPPALRFSTPCDTLSFTESASVPASRSAILTPAMASGVSSSMTCVPGTVLIGASFSRT